MNKKSLFWDDVWSAVKGIAIVVAVIFVLGLWSDRGEEKTEKQRQEIYEEAYKEGYNSGYDKGLEEGYSRGFEEGYDACIYLNNITDPVDY